MASALDTVAHVILPNLMRIKGVATVVSAIERRDPGIFETVWQQCGIEHTPQMVAKERNVWRGGAVSLPTPNEMGEAYMCAFVTKKNDHATTRYFTLEHDYVLATQTTKTLLCELDRQRTRKHGDGPAITGDFQTDAGAFLDAVLRICDPLPSDGS